MIPSSSRWCRGRIAAACVALFLSALALAGCRSAAPGISRPDAVLPVYTVGDRFTFDDGRTDAVVAVDGEHIGWQRSNGYRWTGSRDFVAPASEWESVSRTGALETTNLPSGGLWPLHPGDDVSFSYQSRTIRKDGSADNIYGYDWDCGVGGWTRITVPAGTFEAIPVSCYRYSDSVRRRYYGERIWYYAPAVGHYIRYVDRRTSAPTRQRELKSYRLKLPPLTREQSRFYNNTLQTVLQSVKSGDSHTAEGAGMVVVVSPQRTFRVEIGQYCREYRRMIGLGEREYGARGTSCLMADGRWRPLRRN